MPLVDLGPTVLECSPTTLSVTRFTEVGFEDGVGIDPDEETIVVQASVQPLDNEELMRLPEGDRTEGGVSVFSVVRLQPRDQFKYNGISYEVQSIEDWFDLGGYFKSIAKKDVQEPAIS